MGQVANIPVGDIQQGESKLRDVDREDEQFLHLLESVRKEGVLNSIIVKIVKDPATGSDVYELIDGLQRLTAAREVGLEDIPANIIESAGELRTLSIQMQANMHRVVTKPAQYGKHIRRMLAADPSLDIATLADNLNVSTSFIQQRLSLQTLIPEAQTLVDDSTIKLTQALALAKLPSDEQGNWIEKAATMEATEFVESANARSKDIKDAIRKGKTPGDEKFEARPRLRKVTLIKEEIDQGAVATALCGSAKEKVGFLIALNWAMHLDAPTVEEDRARWEARQAQSARDKKVREEARELKKREKLQKDLSAMEVTSKEMKEQVHA